MSNYPRKTLTSILTLALLTPAAFATTPQIKANNSLGLTWIEQTVAVDNKTSGKLKNTMVSPISAYTALAMLHAGLSGQTRTDLQQSMALQNSGVVDLDNKNEALLNSLRMARKGSEVATDCTKPAAVKSAGDSEGGPKAPVVGIYNSAWATAKIRGSNKPFVFNPSFVSTLSKNYNAEVRSDLEFTAPEATVAVNNWAAQKTNCLIPEIITQNVMQDLIWVLMNATYVEASWKKSFRKMAVAESTPKFNTIDGQKIAVPMIQKDENLRRINGPGFVAVEVPFYVETRDQDLSFFIVQPDDVSKFVANSKDGSLYSPLMWDALLSKFNLMSTMNQSEFLRLQMPKFDFKYSMTMLQNQELTKAVGLNFLFEDGDARARDFVTLGSPTSRVGIIKQDTKIELDENGVKAAAVTLVGGMTRSSLPQEPKETIRIDKPFAFAIANKTTGVILFVGSVVDPTAK